MAAIMNKPLITFLLVVSILVTVAGEVARQHAGLKASPYSLSMIGAAFTLALGMMLLLHHVLEGQRPIRVGSETLPPIKDVASVLVQGEPLSKEDQKKLLLAIRRAKRATTCGRVAKEQAFQIVDHWGGVWDLQAHEEAGGVRGFSINRVFYSGPAAATVAACVGV